MAYIIFSKANRPVEYKVAQNIFSGHGKIAKIEPLDHSIQMKLNVPPSLLVQYEKYDPRRDVVKVGSVIEHYNGKRNLQMCSPSASLMST